MQLLPHHEEASCPPGETARFSFRLRNDTAADAHTEYRLEVGQPFEPGWWRVMVPQDLAPGEEVDGHLAVAVPKDLGAGTYGVRLVADAHQSGRTTGEWRLVVQKKRCAFLDRPPQWSLQPDGSISVTLPIGNCGNVDLDATVEIRHQGGWNFDVSTPDLNLHADAGPLDVDLTLRPPAGESANPGDMITLKVSHEGETLVESSYRLRAPAPTGRSSSPPESRPPPPAPPRIPPRSLPVPVLVGVAIAVVAMGGVALAVVGGAPPESERPTTTTVASPATSTTIGGTSGPATLSAPARIRAVALALDAVSITWAASPPQERVTGYTVYRDGTPLAVVRDAATTYTDAAVAASTTYSYTVDAFDAAGNRSAQSAPAVVIVSSTPDPIPPSPPSGLVARPAGPTEVSLTWRPASDNRAVTGYTLYRNSAEVATVSGTTTAYRDRAATAATTYTYTVEAFDGAGNRSAPSAPARVTTPPGPDTTPPTAPTGLSRVETRNCEEVVLEWSPSRDNVAVTDYGVYRDDELVGNTKGDTTFSEQPADTGVTYTYTVRAFDGAGNPSTPSKELRVLPCDDGNNGID